MPQTEKKSVNMKYPVELLEKIEIFQRNHHFTTRSSAILFLIDYALKNMAQDKN